MLVNEIAMRLGIAWIDGALDGSGASLFGRVACYDPRRPESGCYLCPHDSASLHALSKEAVVSNGCSAAWWKEPDDPSMPTLASSALGGAVAAWQAIWGVKVLLDQSREIVGTETYFDLGHSRLTTHRLKRNSRCLLDHQRWPLTPLGRDSQGATVAQTLAFAEVALNGDVVLHLPHRSIVTTVRCPRCGEEERPYLTLEKLEHARFECACGEDMHVAAADLLDRFSRADARPFLDRTWHEIGLPPDEVVVATCGHRELHIVLSE
jgi:hypothetical protein